MTESRDITGISLEGLGEAEIDMLIESGALDPESVFLAPPEVMIASLRDVLKKRDPLTPQNP